MAHQIWRIKYITKSHCRNDIDTTHHPRKKIIDLFAHRLRQSYSTQRYYIVVQQYDSAYYIVVQQYDSACPFCQFNFPNCVLICGKSICLIVALWTRSMNVYRMFPECSLNFL